MLTTASSGNRLRNISERFTSQEALVNCPECTEPVALHFDTPPSLSCALHGSLYFLTPGVIEVAGVCDCGNLGDALAMLHRVELDYEPGREEETKLLYTARLTCSDHTLDAVMRGKTAEALWETHWSVKRDLWRMQKVNGSDTGAGSGDDDIIHTAVFPAIQFGSLIDTQQQVSLLREGTATMHVFDTNTLKRAKTIDLNAMTDTKGRLCSYPLFIHEDAGGSTVLMLFRDDIANSNESRYHVVIYSHNAFKRATFRAPRADVKCFGQSRGSGRFVVIIPCCDRLLFHIVSLNAGLSAVYQSDIAQCERIVNMFEGGGDMYIDCVVSCTACALTAFNDVSRWRAAKDDTCAPPTKLARFSLLSLPVEQARFDGAAGQLDRFPMATCHYLSEHRPVDVAASVAAGYEGVPYRYCYGRTVSRNNAPLGRFYNALYKADTVDRGRPVEEWYCHGCFPSPATVIRQTPNATISDSFPPDAPSARHAPAPASASVVSRSDQLVNTVRQSSRVFYSYEDDALVVAMVRDCVNSANFVLFVDGHDMTEVGRVMLPNGVPVGLSVPLWVPRDL